MYLPHMRWILFLVLLFVSPAWAYHVGERVYVKFPQLELREQPSYQSPAIGQVNVGQALWVDEVHGRWFYVMDGNTQGWVHRSHVHWEPIKTRLTRDYIPPDLGGNPYPLPLMTQTSMDYCERNNYLHVAPDLQWLEKVAGEISANEVLWFMEQRHLGDFSQ